MILAQLAVADAMRMGCCPCLVGGQGDMQAWFTHSLASSMGWPCQCIAFATMIGSCRMFG